MSKSNPTESLNASIAMLEQKKAQEFQSLKDQLRSTGQSLKPANLIRGAVRDVMGSSQLKSILIKTSIGLLAGWAAKKIITKQKKSAKHQMLGNALQYGMAILASNRNNLLKTAGIYAANSIISAIKTRRQNKKYSNGVDHHDEY